MNVELIEELVEKARLHSLEYVDADVETQFQRKFAELIVRECARIIPNTDLEDVDGGDSAVLRAADGQIKKHFGVEE